MLLISIYFGFSIGKYEEIEILNCNNLLLLPPQQTATQYVGKFQFRGDRENQTKPTSQCFLLPPVAALCTKILWVTPERSTDWRMN